MPSALFWDGNEVWLIVAGGATFAAFPLWYASMFSGFYIGLFLLLAALIVRGVSFEFRGKRDSARWRATWDAALAVGSLVPAFAWGVVFTDLVHGLRLSGAGLFLGNFWALFTPVAVVGGLASLALFVAHGATSLSLNVRAARRPGPGHLDGGVAAGCRPRGGHRGVAGLRRAAGPGLVGGTVPIALAAACALAFVLSGVLVRFGRDGWAFTLSALAHRDRLRRDLHRPVSPGHRLPRPRPVAQRLERRVRALHPGRDDRGGGDLRPVRAGLPGLELVGCSGSG